MEGATDGDFRAEDAPMAPVILVSRQHIIRIPLRRDGIRTSLAENACLEYVRAGDGVFYPRLNAEAALTLQVRITGI